MNKIKYLYYFFIIEVFIVWCFFTFEIKDLKLDINFFKNVSPIISAIAATINLIFVFTIFKLNKKDKKLDDNLSRISYWYRNIIIDRNIDFIAEKFNNIKSLTDNMIPSDCTQARLTGIFENYKVEKRSLIHNVDNMIRILDVEFANQLDFFLDDFEDLYTEKVEDLFTCNSSEWELKLIYLDKEISEIQQQYLKKLYDYERNGYT